jgi:hypothetical protein
MLLGLLFWSPGRILGGGQDDQAVPKHTFDMTYITAA